LREGGVNDGNTNRRKQMIEWIEKAYPGAVVDAEGARGHVAFACVCKAEDGDGHYEPALLLKVLRDKEVLAWHGRVLKLFGQGFSPDIAACVREAARE
jgi:hypothetical protein